jgi:8-oxo-dGTP diphosphatase
VKVIPVVGAVIFRNGKILAAQRKSESKLGGLWEFPGGKIEPNESPRDALTREINEELEAEIEIHEEICTTIYEYDFATIKLTTFRCTIQTDILTLNEHQDAKWLNTDDIHSVTWAPADIPTINAIIGAD